MHKKSCDMYAQKMRNDGAAGKLYSIGYVSIIQAIKDLIRFLIHDMWMRIRVFSQPSHALLPI